MLGPEQKEPIIIEFPKGWVPPQEPLVPEQPKPTGQEVHDAIEKARALVATRDETYGPLFGPALVLTETILTAYPTHLETMLLHEQLQNARRTYIIKDAQNRLDRARMLITAGAPVTEFYPFFSQVNSNILTFCGVTNTQLKENAEFCQAFYTKLVNDEPKLTELLFEAKLNLCLYAGAFHKTITETYLEQAKQQGLRTSPNPTLVPVVA